MFVNIAMLLIRGGQRDFQQNDDPVFPVINLKSDIQITGGDGSKSNPYIVE